MKERELGREIHKISCMLGRKIECERNHYGMSELSYLHSGIIRYLDANRERDIYPRDIVKKFSVTRSTVTEALQKMERSGFIHFIPSQKDARMKKIMLAEPGEAMLNRLRMHTGELERLLVKGMTEEEVDILFSLLQKLQANLQENLSCPCRQKKETERVR